MLFKHEPLSDGNKIATIWDLIYAIRWYHENASERDAAEYLGVNVGIASQFETLAWIERLLTRGYVLDARSHVTLQAMRLKLKNQVRLQANQDVDLEPRPEVNIQERTKQKALEFVDMLDDMVSAMDIWEKKKNYYEWFIELGVKPNHVGYMVSELEKLIKEAVTTKEDKDSDSDVRRKADIKMWNLDQAYKDLKRILDNKNVDRKPRKKKAIDAGKLIKDLKYCVSSDEFKVKSVNPLGLIGATQIWTFNTKYRLLGLLVAKEGHSMTVKGTTVQDYDPDKSFTKTLRKPDEVLQKILSGARKTNMQTMSAITSKPAPFTGRISGDVVILKVENK